MKSAQSECTRSKNTLLWQDLFYSYGTAFFLPEADGILEWGSETAPADILTNKQY